MTATATVPKTIELPPEGAELVYLDPELVVIPDDNPPHSPATLADLETSMRALGQLDPGWVCPAPDLATPRHRLCFEGCGRLIVCRRIGIPFRAFDLGRYADEPERIRRMFAHHGTRRRWNREVIAAKGARFIELTGATAAVAARELGCSEATLSRAFGDRRIPLELKPKAELLGPSIRSLVAALPSELMPQVVEFALAPREDGNKRPTRDQVAAYIQQLRKQANGQAKGRKARTVTLRMNGRVITLAVGEKDSASTVAEDLKALAAGLVKHAGVEPAGWPFLFQQ
jgi:hypothetical protein